ncbi:hypothetical protein GCM10018955_45450 [Planomonospora venezuelensis]
MHNGAEQIVCDLPVQRCGPIPSPGCVGRTGECAFSLHGVDEAFVAEDPNRIAGRRSGDAELSLEFRFAWHGVAERDVSITDPFPDDVGYLDIDVGVTFMIDHSHMVKEASIRGCGNRTRASGAYTRRYISLVFVSFVAMCRGVRRTCLDRGW